MTRNPVRSGVVPLHTRPEDAIPCALRFAACALQTGRAITLLACALLCLSSGLARAANRFPKPEFESGYQLPSPAYPQPALVNQYLDVAVLCVALGLAAYLALQRRSRAGIFALMCASLLYFGFWRKGCVCPIGSIQNMAYALGEPAYRVPLVVAAFFILPLAMALVCGRVFCAAVCPLGAVQDALVLRPVRVPTWLAQTLSMGPYLYLGCAVLFAATGAGFLICRLDPFVPLFRLSGSATMLGLAACFLLLGMFVARPYCRFVCPYGVLLNWLARISKWHVRITPDECVQCRLCEDACPFGAILPPTPAQLPEERATGVRRLIVLLLLLPVLAAAGGWAGRQLCGPLAQAHPAVRLAEQVWREETGLALKMTTESEAFRGTGTPLAALYAQAAAVQRQFALGGWILGGFLGVIFCGKMIALSLQRKRVDYEPDRGACVSCGRCFEYCPKEQVRRNARS